MYIYVHITSNHRGCQPHNLNVPARLKSEAPSERVDAVEIDILLDL